MDVERQWTDEQLEGDDVSKKDLVVFLQENASLTFQAEHKIKGQVKSVSKSRGKDELALAYKQLFETKAFKQEGEEAAAAEAATAAAEAQKEMKDVTERTKKLSVSEDEGPPKYKKTNIIKKGDKINFPKKGDVVGVFYVGKFEDGKVFDKNAVTGRKANKAQPLKFKVGLGKVIRGWDEVLMTMSTGEKCEVSIEAEWAYGRKGLEGKVPGEYIVPKNTNLIFEIELVKINA